jgi:hypothetical protein
LVDQYKAVFGNRSPVEFSEEQVAAILPSIRRAFHFMENKAFEFSTIPGQPLRGWEDFLTFAHAYDAPPPLQRTTFGPYYFSFHVPSP